MAAFHLFPCNKMIRTLTPHQNSQNIMATPTHPPPPTRFSKLDFGEPLQNPSKSMVLSQLSLIFWA